MKHASSIRFHDKTKQQLVELAEAMGATQTDVIALAIDRLYQDNKVEISNETLRALNMCPRDIDRVSAEQRQKVLRTLGDLALPPKGHSCPMCSQPGDLYCLDVAIQRLRGIQRKASP